MVCLYGKNILSAFSIRDNMVTVLLQNSLSNDIHTLFLALGCQNAQSSKTVSPRAVHCVLSAAYFVVPVLIYLPGFLKPHWQSGMIPHISGHYRGLKIVG